MEQTEEGFPTSWEWDNQEVLAIKDSLPQNSDQAFLPA